ncbi:unnamed protein product [Adineta steineri]|uniref:Steroid 5-alpha reductase C-terminal domain-containing protein n=3 Tax=Adineta steineri TaxID=433720 RepID=A0A815PYA3_9BILA|nr:unnamed protein product [Adineta steineri]
MQLFINTPCSYFRIMDNFTGLIEFLPGIICSLLYTWQIQNQSLEFRQILITICVILWALRLGGFLVLRMFVLGPLDTRIDNLVRKYGYIGVILFWLGPHAFWSVICCLPVVLIHTFPIPHIKFSIFDFFGFVIWTCGFFMETLADRNKLNAKLIEKKQYYYLGSLWNYCRNPNHCGEVFCWLGISIISFNLFIYHSVYKYNFWTLILIPISPLFTLFAMLFEATLTSEIRNNKRFGNESNYLQYRKQTSILWPISPKIYPSLPKWIRKIIFFELNLYNKGLKTIRE